MTHTASTPAPAHIGAQQGDSALGLLVTLTASDNTHLRSRLPLAGRLEVVEVGVDGTIIHAVFRILEDGGRRLSVPIEVRNPQFLYGDATLIVTPTTAAEHYQLGVHHLTLATSIHEAQTAPGDADSPEGPLSPSELFERHMRLSKLHFDASLVRTTGAVFVATRPPLGHRSGSAAEQNGWRTELDDAVHPVPSTNP